MTTGGDDLREPPNYSKLLRNINGVTVENLDDRALDGGRECPC